MNFREFYLNRDKWKRLYNHVLALDAIFFSEFKSQFDEINVHRELVKCVCGFQAEYGTEQATIATGNWGCGAFNGNKQLKGMKRKLVLIFISINEINESFKLLFN